MSYVICIYTPYCSSAKEEEVAEDRDKKEGGAGGAKKAVVVVVMGMGTTTEIQVVSRLDPVSEPTREGWYMTLATV
jgi:hypothetical protein